MEHSGTFLIEREDHTLGNILRMQLLEDDDIHFAGYRMPHPLEHKICVQVQTNGECNPSEALMRACHRLTDKISRIEEKFDAEVARKQREPDRGF